MDGALIIDKPAGLTSHDVVARVRRITGVRRVGHTGTLDPFATGVLVALVGRATRLAQFLSGAEKEYTAVIRFGYATDTGDATGSALNSGPTMQSAQSLLPDKIEAAMSLLRSAGEQTPPMYSAKKVGGRKLYELARRGEEVERKSVRIKVSEFAPIQSNTPRLNDDGTADLDVRIVCSAGTYIRTLAEDLGKQLGVGAHLSELRRTRAGNFCIGNAVTLETLAARTAANEIERCLITPDQAVAHLPAARLDAAQARQVLNGIALDLSGTQTELQPGPVRLQDSEGNLLAVGIYDDQRRSIHPKVVIAIVQ